MVHSLDDQIELSIRVLNAKTRNIDKYEWLMNLYSINVTLFYALAVKHVCEIMPLIYTPTVGEGCQAFNLVCPQPR